LTASNLSAGFCFVGRRFIDAQYSLWCDGIQAKQLKTA
jgi:hypothetical protein